MEHLQALDRAAFDGPFHLGVVGRPELRRELRAFVTAARKPACCYEAASGWEQHTLRHVARYARRRKPLGLVLYMHSKGAHRGGRLQAAWRRSMTCALLHNLDALTGPLNAGFFDAAGCHWLTPRTANVSGAHFAGNFWLACTRFLRTLPPPADGARHDAEGWLGSGEREPRVLDLLPGWPGTQGWFHQIGWPK